MFAQHHRFAIWSTNQHPYNHDPSEFGYTHDGLPGVDNMGAALDWILAVLYPNSKDQVATPAALPLVGNTINDYRVVNDDGDGKAASYRWEQREGDPAEKWYKIYDMDWGEQTVLSNFLNITQDVYVYKSGMDDLDDTGTAYAGELSGQRIYGGASENTNLILYANSGDDTSIITPINTGSIFAGDKLSPLTDNVFSLGTILKRWSDVQTSLATVANIAISSGSIVSSSSALDFGDNALSTTGSYSAGSISIAAGSITDSSGAISFGDENLTTTGSIAATSATVTSLVSTNITQLGGGGPVTEASSLIGPNAVAVKFNASYAQTFPAANSNELLNAKITMKRSTATGGNVYARLRSTTAGVPDPGLGGVLISSDPIASLAIPITDTVIEFTFSSSFNLVAGTVYAIEIDGSEQNSPNGPSVYFGIGTYANGEMFNTTDDGASWSAFGADLNFEINSLSSGGATGLIHAIAGVYGASLLVDADVDAAAAIEFSKLEALTADRAVQTSGTGVMETSAVTALELSYLSGVTSAIQTQIDGKASTALDNLATPTAINKILQPGVSDSLDLGTFAFRWQNLFLSGAISDGTNNITLDRLLMFRDAVGTVDGQSLFWNDTAQEWLPSAPDTEIDHNTISNLTVGDVHTQYVFLSGRTGGQTLYGSDTAAEFLTLIGSPVSSGGVRIADMLLPDADLGGRNIGSSGLRWVNLYMSGEIVGGRIENITSGSLPSASGLNVGRMYWTTDTKDLLVDTGTALQRLSQENIVVDVVWDGVQTSDVQNVSASIEDATKAVWAVYDAADGYKEIKGAELTKSTTQVTVTTQVALPAGTYRLIGIR